MPDFLFAYHGGTPPKDEEEAAKTMAAWEAWFATMGEAVVIPGNPVGMSITVSSEGVADNGGANPVSGYSVIAAPDIQAAAGYAKGCPMVVDGSGSIEIAELFEM